MNADAARRAQDRAVRLALVAYWSSLAMIGAGLGAVDWRLGVGAVGALLWRDVTSPSRGK